MRGLSFTRFSIGSVVSMALSVALAGCDCAGATQSCERDDECPTGQQCVDGTCGVRADGSTGDGGRRDGGDRDGHIGPPDAGPCRAVSGESTVAPVPVDIIIVIDNSGSMTEEAAEVQRNINNFAAIIAASGLDYRVVLISRKDTTRNGVCVPPPLGSGPPGCDSGEEGRLLALDVGVGSTNGPSLALSQYPNYRDFLRLEAAKVFLWITDDESAMTSNAIRDGFAALEPAGMFENTIHNAIVGYNGDTPETWGSGTDRSMCPSLARVGVRYLRLVNCLRDDGTPIEGCTTGRQAKVCETDWTPIFDEIARGIVAGVPVSCEFAIPEPPEGLVLNYEMIGVTYRSGDEVRMPLRRVENADACAGDGWYFDDPVEPTEILLCPELCSAVQLDPDARMDVALGCLPILM